MNDLSLDKEIYLVLEKIWVETKPISIFLYGSRARKDFKKESDYEIGIIFDKNKISRSEIAKMHDLKSLVVYPFLLDDIKNFNIDTPFPKAIYLKELIETGKTFFGEKILENMTAPKIEIIDLIQATSFEIGTAMAAVRSFRTGDLITASINFKSALFGARILEILELKKFPYTYDEIWKLSKELNLSDEYNQLLDQAIKIRQGEKIEEKWLFKNITFLNQEVMRRVKEEYKKITITT